MQRFLLFLFFIFPGTTKQNLVPVSWTKLKIDEPSGICRGSAQNYFVASNNGVLCEIDPAGKLIRSEKLGMDIEDVCLVGSELHVLDESLRLIYVLDESSWKIKRTCSVNYNGARNKGFESLTYIPEKKHFILITEKQPLLLFETDENYQVLNQVELEGFSDVSSATYFDHALWLLSDEDHAVVKMDVNEYSAVRTWSIPVYNPEGICFDPSGQMRIVSDDTRRMYLFSIPQLP